MAGSMVPVVDESLLGSTSGNGMVRPCSCPASKGSWQGGAKDKEHAMCQTPNTAIAVIGIDIGKNPFHVVGLDARGATIPVDPPRSFGRCGDDGVDLFGIERVMNHQRLSDRQNSLAMLGDQRLSLRRARRTQAALSIAPSPSMRRMVLLPLAH